MKILRRVVNKYRSFGAIEFFKIVKSVIVYYFARDILKHRSLVKKIYDYKLKLDLHDMGISRQLVIHSAREQQLRYILIEEIQKGMTILDVGANIGYYPIMEAKLVSDNGFIYAIEPAPNNYKQLIENIRLNNLSHVFETYNIGVSNKKGIERFYLSDHSNLHTFMPRSVKGDYITKGTTDNYSEVEVTDLTSFLKDKKSIDLIRMDVEGYEVEIFEGLEEAIKSGLFKGKIIFECHFPKYDDVKHSLRKQLEMLIKNNYLVKIMTSNNEATSKIRTLGYKPEKVICTSDDFYQGIYRDITENDAIRLICELGGIRDVLLTKG